MSSAIRLRHAGLLLLATVTVVTPCTSAFAKFSAIDPGEKAQAKAEDLSEISALSNEIWTDLNLQFVQLYERGDRTQARRVAQKAFDLSNKVFGMNHVNTADSLLKLGLISEMAGEYPSAEAFLMGSLAILRDQLGYDHPNIAIVLTNLGNVHYQLRRHSLAEQSHLQALNIRMRTLGRLHPSTAQSLYNLAVLYEHSGNFGEAQTHFQEALEIWAVTNGASHPSVATALDSLGNLYYSSGDFAKAAAAYQHALTIHRQAHGDSHIQVARSLINLGLTHLRLSDFVSASNHYREALDIAETLYGPEHPQVGLLLYSLANVYHAQAISSGDTYKPQGSTPVAGVENQYLSQALPLYERAVAILDHGRDKSLQRALAASISELASLYKALGQQSEAEKLQARLNKID